MALPYTDAITTLEQTTWDVNGSNGTTANPVDEGWYIAYNSILIAITITIMFSMGTAITIDHLKIIFVRPVGPIVGAVCQLILMPACCCGYALLLGLDDNIAIGMVLVGSCPGGSISNIMTFWCRADIILSVCMTTISTTLALIFLPLNMWIYSRFWVDDMSQMPFGNMIITVLYLWAAVLVGYIFGRIFPKTIPYITKFGSIFAFILILTAGFIQGYVYPEIFDHTWQTYLAAWTMPIIGFFIGFFLAWIFCQKIKQRLTIGFETGIQNTTLALTVVALTFPTGWESSYWSQFIILYTTFQVVLGIGTVICVWIYNGIRYRETPCTTKDKFSLEEGKIQMAQVGPTVNRQVTDDDGAGGPLHLVSVATADGQIIIKAADNDIDDNTSTRSSVKKRSASASSSSSSSIHSSTSFGGGKEDPTAVDIAAIKIIDEGPLSNDVSSGEIDTHSLTTTDDSQSDLCPTFL